MTKEEKLYAKAFHKGVGAGYRKALCDVIDLVGTEDFWIKVRIAEIPQLRMIQEIGKLGCDKE